MTFDQYWKSVESSLGPTTNPSLRLALYECAKKTWADASAAVIKAAEEADSRWSADNLAARIKELPDDQLKELSSQLAHHDRTCRAFLNAEHDARHAYEEARSLRCSDLHDR